MKIRNFTGLIPSFIGGFSNFLISGSSGILWDVSTYNLSGTLQTTNETSPTGIWFKPDGTKLIAVGTTQDRLKSWDLTVPWDITSATNFTNMTGSLRDTTGVLLTSPTGVSFSDDGTKAFVTDSINNALYRYSLTTAWDITTLNGVNADQVNTTIYTGNLTPQSIWTRPDGLMFLTANSGATSQYRTWTSAVANDITTLTAGTSLTGASTPIGANIVDNGNRLIYLQQANDLLTIGSTGSAYNISSVTTTNTRVMTTQDTTPQDIYMRNDGQRFYYLGSSTDDIYQFTL